MTKRKRGRPKGSKSVRRKTGPKPNWFKQWCGDAVFNLKRRKFIEDMADGKPVDTFVTQQGEEIPIQAKARDRKDLFFELANYAYGKPTQAVQNTDQEGNVIPPVVVLMPQDKGEEGKIS